MGEWLKDALPGIINNGAPWLIVFLVVTGWIRYVRKNADARIAESRAHTREMLELMRAQTQLQARSVESTEQVLSGLRTVESVVAAALPPGEGGAS